MGRLAQPLIPTEEAECVHKVGNEKPLNEIIGAYKLNAPPEPTLAEITHGHMPVHAARVTITYQDVFGRKHASTFDYVQRWRGKPAVFEDLKTHGGWELVAFQIDLTSDLNDVFGP